MFQAMYELAFICICTERPSMHKIGNIVNEGHSLDVISKQHK